MQRSLRAILARCELDGDCVIWTGARCGEAREYGQARFDGRALRVHRVVWELVTDSPIPEGYDVLHTCDNPPCVWPGHLWLGTHTQNMWDCRLKGRDRKAKLTEAQVRVILADPRTQDAIAAEYGVHRSLIGRIKQGQKWSLVHV